ncbi:hypoxia-inducible lipid droplet-associated protein [Trichosurus vulpecula]|uniref:hypoxia-inducible lipid droplet-associated protein n=1 Tax=Trichosurus vulpecula TaxID=9337 RepID=UPI00186B4FC4|nr:hypoxia-inducible lipid droplet-associated protein [Trichosurus vulpecula]XP_036616922.1 hypoxia-inducible lipid droplet-associated protein [Trichosurus vulpecula]
MKHVLNLYLLGMLLSFLSIFVRLMESLGGLLEGYPFHSHWLSRSQRASINPPKGLPDKRLLPTKAVRPYL